ncbi:MAG: D-xylose ABC transporter ATP-binding protein [Thermoprotei archaeon]|nr:MAG: D-xylose ABC transporter ATP-binding protein [Thermoprotei archaeon]
MRAMSPSREPLLKAIGIVKKFPGVIALKGVDFDLYEGEIHALVGQNGAGKSTFVKILNGIFVPDSGKILLNGREVSIKSAGEAKRLGITLVHQEITLVPYLSVAENVYLAKMPFMKKPVSLVNRREVEAFASKYLELLELRVDPWTKVKELSVGEQQLVQIARALAEDAKIICLDEPTSPLTPGEVKRLFRILRELRERGKAIIFITHHIEEVFEIADRVTILRDGVKVATLSIEKATPRDIVKLMIGKEPSEFYVTREKKVERREEPILVVRNLSTVSSKLRGTSLNNISFELYRGEILGITGLLGSGKTELGKALIGMEKVVSGEIILEGSRVSINNPIQALRLGIYYLPENRRLEGLVPTLTVRENIVLSLTDYIARLIGIRKVQIEKSTAVEWVKKLNIVTPSTEVRVMNLSGGNQQKTVIAKALVAKPKIMVFDEPTMGIDVEAKVEIRRIIRELAETGLSIILLSSDVDEVLTLADRIMVLYKGKQVALLPNKDLSRDRILELMSGGAP